MKEQFFAFASWVQEFAVCIDEWEKANGKEYATENLSSELNILAGMFESGMTPKEAADTYLEADERVMFMSQYNAMHCAQVLKLCKENGGEILAFLAREGSGYNALVKAHNITHYELLKHGSEALYEYGKAINAGKIDGNAYV